MALNVRGSDSLYWKTGLDNSGLQAGATQAKGILAGLRTSISSMDVFGALKLAGIYSFAQIIHSMYRFSSEFEKSMAEVSTISKMVANDLKGMSQVIIDMSTRFPDDAKILSKALYQIASAGYTGAESFNILEESAKLAVATVTDTFNTADALTSVMNAYGEKAGEVAHISDNLFTIVRIGKTTMRELAPEITTITGLAAQAGISFDELSAIIAESVKTLKTPIAMTGIRGILNALISEPTETGQKIVDYLKIYRDFDFSLENARAMGFVNFMQELYKATDGNIKILNQLFPNIRGLTGLMSVMVDEGNRLNSTFDEFQNNMRATDDAFIKMEATTSDKWAKIKNNITATLKPTGDVLMAVFGFIGSEINKTINLMNLLETSVRNGFKNISNFIGNLPLLQYLTEIENKLRGISGEKSSIKPTGYVPELTNIPGVSKNKTQTENTTFWGASAAAAKATKKQAELTMDEILNTVIPSEKEMQNQLTDIEDRFAKERIDAITNDFAKRRALIEYNYKVESEKLKGNTAALAILKKERDFLLSGVGKEEKQSQMGAFDFYTVSNKYRADIKNQYTNIFDENTKKLQEATDKEKRLYELDADNYETNLGRKKNLSTKDLKYQIDSLKKHVIESKKIYGENSAEYHDWLMKLGEKEDELYEKQKQNLLDIGSAINNLGSLVSKFNSNLGESISKVGQISNGLVNMSSSLESGNIISGIASGIETLIGISDLLKSTDGLTESFADRIKRRNLEYANNMLGQINRELEEYELHLENITSSTDRNQALENALVYLKYERDLLEQELKPGVGVLDVSDPEIYRNTLNTLSNIKSEIADIYKELTGTTAESIADSISEGFSQGMNSAEVFADNFNDLMKNAILSAFKSTIITNQLKTFYEQFAMLSQSGLTKSEIDILRNNFTAALNNIQITWDAISEIANESGINLISGSKSSTNSLSGAIQGITESTAGVLEGQLNNLMMNVIKITDKSDLSLNALREIRDNTYPLNGIYSKSDLSLNALREIRDAGYYLDDIYNINLNINNNLSIIKSVGLDNLAANKETAVNTRYLKLIDDKLSALNSGTNVRALGV